MKYAVGLMLTTFGLFWVGEGAGLKWPGTDLALVGILVYLLLFSTVLISSLRRRHARLSPIGTYA
jgi:uncharacterized membrane protein